MKGPTILDREGGKCEPIVVGTVIGAEVYEDGLN
jgi:hypothetical protein